MKRFRWLVIVVVALLMLIPSLVLADVQFAANTSATLFVSVYNHARDPVNDANVTITLRAPDGTAIFFNQNMTYVAGSYGLYAYNFTTPAMPGSYVADSYAAGYGYGSESVQIVWLNTTTNYYANNYTIFNNYTTSNNYTYITNNYTGGNLSASGVWNATMSGFSDGNTFGGLLASLGGNTAMGLVQIILVIALLGFALWKKGWLRILLSVGTIIWGAFAMPYDIKIAAPLLAVGLVLFIEAVIRQIQHAREATE
jgi:hypothetical protein